MLCSAVRRLPARLRLAAILALCGLLACLLGGTIRGSAAPSPYHFDSWTTDNGLPQNTVNDILQTRDGYLWLATLDGLVRYDGVRFTVFNTQNSRGIQDNRFTLLYEARDSSLWIGKEDGGLTRYRDGLFVTYSLKDGLPLSLIYLIGEDADGRLWLSTSRGVFEQRGEAFAPVPAPADVTFSFRASSGANWFFGAGGIRAVTDGVTTEYGPAFKFAKDEIMALCEDREHGLWASTARFGLLEFRRGLVRRYAEKDGLPSGPIQSIYEDRSGNLWFGADSGELLQLRSGRFTPIAGGAERLPSRVISMYEDREGTFWAGTMNTGLYRLSRKTVTAYSERDGLLVTQVYPIYEDRAGTIWIGGSGLSSYAAGKFTSFGPKEGLRETALTSLYEDREGRLWIGSAGRLSYRKDGRFVDSSGLLGLPAGNYNVFAIHEDTEGGLWFATDKGLVKLSPNGPVIYTAKDGLAGNDVKVIYEDRQGQLWFGTYDGLSKLENGRFVSYTEAQGLANNRVRAIYEDSDGIMWIGTYDGGLSRFKDGRFTNYTTAQGLFNNGVFQILEDRRGNFWMSSNLGIYRVSRQQLNAYAEGRARIITCVAYGKPDGMLNTECNGGRQPAGIRARDGRLWFPTQTGVAVIDPDAVSLNEQSPPVVIESCMVDRDSVGISQQVRIAPGQADLEIQYTGLSFIKPEQMRFRYKLEGLDAAWVEAGTRRAAYYSHLPPGDYTFLVTAANSDGIWNAQAASLRVIVIPPFYRTWWFITVSGLVVAGTALLAYERRVNHLERRNREQAAFARQLIESQEGERKRIAGELHDSLGQRLVVIKNLALLVLNQPAAGANGQSQIDEISAEASNAINEVKEISYNLRPYQLDRLGLTKAIEAVLAKAQAASGIEFVADLTSLDHVFSPDLEINLYRIVQECVNNIVKHSAASRATVTIRREGARAVLTIGDNGKGFVPGSAVAAEVGKGGFGLIGIGERARLLGGRVAIQSAPGSGTTVTVSIDLGTGGSNGDTGMNREHDGR